MKSLQVGSSVCMFLTASAFYPAWAADMDAPGLRNFHQVNEHVYRGGQPTGEGWKSLAQIGVKTVLDLRLESEHSTKEEARAVQAAGMRYYNLPMHGVVAPSDQQVAKALALLNSEPDGPVFVHCRRGADRTGTVIACYRMVHDHWDNQRAFKEAKSYGMSWTQFGMKRYINQFQPPAERAATPVLQTAAPAPSLP